MIRKEKIVNLFLEPLRLLFLFGIWLYMHLSDKEEIDPKELSKIFK